MKPILMFISNQNIAVTDAHAMKLFHSFDFEMTFWVSEELVKKD